LSGGYSAAKLLLANDDGTTHVDTSIFRKTYVIAKQRNFNCGIDIQHVIETLWGYFARELRVLLLRLRAKIGLGFRNDFET